MHWFWRTMIAVVAWGCGSICTGIAWLLWNFIMTESLGELPDFFVVSVLAGVPCCLALVFYTVLTRRFLPTPNTNNETRCRKCGYILRGIPEPRCSECGERI